VEKRPKDKKSVVTSTLVIDNEDTGTKLSFLFLFLAFHSKMHMDPLSLPTDLQ